jgi:transcriptional regulator with XRE-family HTH domain
MAELTDRTSELGRTLRKHREAAEWSRETLAREAGVSASTIARVELDGHKPTLSNVFALASALGLNAVELLGGAS